MNPFSPLSFFDLGTFPHQDLFRDLEYVWEALDFLPDFLNNLSINGLQGDISSEAYLINSEQIIVAKGAIIEPGAYVKGPCYIGPNSQVRHGAYIRGNVYVGEGACVGHATEVKNSIFLPKAQAGHFAYVGDSILGTGVNLGAGFKCANLRLDKEEISVRAEGKLFSTGRRKLGLIAGDYASLGCNGVSNPGTLIAKGLHSFPCKTFSGYISEQKRMRS